MSIRKKLKRIFKKSNITAPIGEKTQNKNTSVEVKEAKLALIEHELLNQLE
ncbi:MAG: hypothetical protein LAT76_00275 [Schleiferiaceae bacterium]|nr:hypothetical protein [Schleiferiaceae bacterium]